MVKQRCLQCKKKTGMMSFTCKCNNIYCLQCKLPEIHSCSFDYKKESKDILNKTLEKVVPDKMNKI